MAAMATVKSTTLIYWINHVLQHPKPIPPVFLFLRPFSLIPNHHENRRFPFFHPSISSSLPLPSPSQSFSSVVESEQDEENVSSVSLSENHDEEVDANAMRESGRCSEISEEMMMMMTKTSALNLSVKEKKKLSSYAHSLGDKLKCQLVGKSGVTDSVVFSLLETLEKNELLKVKIHKTCPGELRDMILHLEEATGSVSVGQIARTVILYRPSLTKLKVEEKKEQE